MTPASDDPEIAAKAAGRERGRDWALERAGYVELAPLEDLARRPRPAGGGIEAREVDGAMLALGRVHDWWRDGETVGDPFAAGFVAGALEVFAEIEDQL
jgi:hypothetical protein